VAFIIEDDFYEASPPVRLENHTPLDGGSWVRNTFWMASPAYYGQVDNIDLGWGVKSIYWAETSSTGTAYYHSAVPGQANMDVYYDQAVRDKVGTAFWGKGFCILRASRDTTRDGLAFGYDSQFASYGIRVYTIKNGVWTGLFNGGSVPDNTDLKLKMEVRGDDFELFRDTGSGYVSIWGPTTVDDVSWGDDFLVWQAGNTENPHDYIAVEFATSPPVKPTISIAGQGPDFIDLASSAFGPGIPVYGQTHAQWQVTLAADTGFATPIIDVTSTNAAAFEAFHAAGGLNLFLNQYIARVRHGDSGTGSLRWSDWSDASSATSLETSGQYYTAFAERPIGVNIRTDVPADWSELDISDGESTWFLEERADATCLVTMDRVSKDTPVPDADTVDPIFWEGFPSVAQQIVFGRFVIDNITSSGATCSSGVADASGIICREVYGLKFGPLYGPAGSGGVNPAGNTDPWLCDASAIQLNDTGYDALDTDWVQVAWKRSGGNYWEQTWPYLEVGSILATQRHLCGLYQTWGWAAITQGDAGLASPPPDFWVHNKMGPLQNGRAARELAWESHVGHPAEQRVSQFAPTGGDVKVGVICSCLHSPCYPVEWCFDEIIVCAGNRVRILDLPYGWLVHIGGTGPHVSASPGFWPQTITGDGSDDQYIDFGHFAFPADTMYVWFKDSNRLDPPDIEWDVPTGIWGGDEYRILSGILGAAGVGARLSGTPEGSDGTGYIAYLDANDGLKLDKWSQAGGKVNLATVGFDLIPGTYYNVVLETTGTTIRAKAWAGGAGLQGDPENNDPGTWAIELTDVTYATGVPGLVGLTDQPVDFDAFAVGLGGDPYPTGRYPGACTWVNPVEGIILDTADSPLLLEWLPPSVTAGVLGGELVYELEFQPAGESGWAPLASNIRTTTYSWDLSSLTAGYYCVRVRAYAGCEYGPWANVCFQWLGGVAKVPDGYFFGDWYTGESDVGMWIRLFQASHFDDGQPVPGCLVTRELMPAGAGGECLFQKLYVVVTATTQGTLQVTPILDGKYLSEERRYIQLLDFDPDDPDALPPSGQAQTKRYEIDLTRGYGNPELWRYGYRGTYWQVEVCATDYSGQGRIEIDGVFVRYTVVRETHTWARPFYGELEVDVELETLSRFFFGTTTDDADGAIYRAEQGNSDFGEKLTVIVEPNKYAPFGTGNEGWFRTLYLSVTRSNGAAMALEVTPLLDQAALEVVTVQLPAVTQPVTEVHEIPLSVPHTRDGIEVGRQGARGVWFSYRIANSTVRASGEIIFNGAALEAIPVRETEPGVT
jgi:hypothetical protein